MHISGRTRLLGLIGWPVEHSFSPAMHNAAAEKLGLDVTYVALPVRPGDVETAVRGLGALGFLGVNVTVPHKQAVIPLLHDVEPAARAIGAVNTIKVLRDDDEKRAHISSRTDAGDTAAARLHGYNTDWSGFLLDLEARHVPLQERDCVVLGAGGSARAVVYGLAQKAGRIFVYGRRLLQAQELVAQLAPYVPDVLLIPCPWEALHQLPEQCRDPLIVNTTPVGMHPQVDASPWPLELPFPEGAFLYDLVYNPRETQLVREASAAGCQVANGLGMLLYQGALAFEIWLGLRPPLDVLASALEQ